MRPGFRETLVDHKNLCALVVKICAARLVTETFIEKAAPFGRGFLILLCKEMDIRHHTRQDDAVPDERPESIAANELQEKMNDH